MRYPFAATNDGQVEAIEDARRGGAYTCLGCGAAMVARRGAVRVAHFAHKPPTETCGDPDRGLHEVAKALIVQGFTAALEAGGEYRAGFGCEDADEVFGVSSKQCQRCRAEDARRLHERAGAHAWAESAISGLRADTHPGKEVEIRTWERDKFGHPLAPEVIERIHENAVILRRLGSVQQTRKPWLFLYQIPRGGGRLYADFGRPKRNPSGPTGRRGRSSTATSTGIRTSGGMTL